LNATIAYQNRKFGTGQTAMKYKVTVKEHARLTDRMILEFVLKPAVGGKAATGLWGRAAVVGVALELPKSVARVLAKATLRTCANTGRKPSSYVVSE